VQHYRTSHGVSATLTEGTSDPPKQLRIFGGVGKLVRS
jgi:hypothetical protein